MLKNHLDFEGDPDLGGDIDMECDPDIEGHLDLDGDHDLEAVPDLAGEPDPDGDRNPEGVPDLAGDSDLEIDPDLVVDQFEIKTKLEALNRIIESKKIFPADWDES